MAVLTLNQQVVFKWTDDGAAETKLYELLNITTGDTIDMSPDFKVVKRAVMLGITVAGAVVAANAGNVITIPSGVSADAAYLLVYGVHNS
jgi:hypothetical protein